LSEQLKCLVRLQFLENRKAALLKTQAETPLRLQRLDQEFSRLESEYLLKKNEYQHIQKLHRSVEREISELEYRLARSENRKNKVKSNREYQAVLKEIEDLQREISDKEDEALRFMEELDALEREIATLAKEVASKKEQIAREKERLLQEREQVNDRIAELERLQEEIKEKLQPDLLRRWNFLLERCNGIAVAPVENGVCQICHLNLPPQKFIELQKDENIMVCPNCHRFIYWPGREEYELSSGSEDI